MMRINIATRCLLTAALVCTCAVLTAAADWLDTATSSKIKTFDGTAQAKKSDTQKSRRGQVTIRRIDPVCECDWDNDQTALPYFFYQLRERTDSKYPCYVDNRGILLTGDEIFDYPIIYLTAHGAVTFTDDEVENLKKYLARGGTLWLDDCTGSGPFIDSMPANIQRIIPGADMKLMLRETKAFFDFFNIMYEVKGMPPLKEQFMQPFQVAYMNGRPAIIVCPDDYGCMAWEVSSPPTSMNPLGTPAHADPTPTVQHARELIYQLCFNWLFYSMAH